MMMMMFLFFSQSFDHQQQQCGKCGVETGAEEMAVTNPSLCACVCLSLSPTISKPTISNLQLQSHLSEKGIWVANLFAILGKIF
jgi:hypothetical protein